MVEIRITVRQAESLTLLIERALDLSNQSANTAHLLGLDVETRERVQSVKKKIKIS